MVILMKSKRHISEYLLEKKIKKLQKQEKESTDALENIGLWVSYYRLFPHIFVQDYLNIKLKWFQIILIYCMNHYPYFMYLASRGQGKTFLTAVYICYRAILYPLTEIKIAAGVKSQSREVIEKIDSIMKGSPLLQNEIDSISTSINNARVDFRNGSDVQVVVASDNSRGGRAHLIICDEFRMIDKSVIDNVLRKRRNLRN